MGYINNYNNMENYKEIQIHLSPTVFFSGLSHAYISSNEEIMGVLIGKIKENEQITIIEITSSHIIKRKYKSKDRVEFPIEEMSKVLELDELKKNNTHVVGWYHSHPNITSLPSHIDLATQLSWQMMEPNFIGLIYSVYVIDKMEVKSSLIAFRTPSDNKTQLLPILFKHCGSNEELSNNNSMLKTLNIILDECNYD